MLPNYPQILYILEICSIMSVWLYIIDIPNNGTSIYIWLAILLPYSAFIYGPICSSLGRTIQKCPWWPVVAYNMIPRNTPCGPHQTTIIPLVIYTKRCISTIQHVLQSLCVLPMFFYGYEASTTIEIQAFYVIACMFEMSHDAYDMIIHRKLWHQMAHHICSLLMGPVFVTEQFVRNRYAINIICIQHVCGTINQLTNILDLMVDSRSVIKERQHKQILIIRSINNLTRLIWCSMCTYGLIQDLLQTTPTQSMMYIACLSGGLMMLFNLTETIKSVYGLCKSSCKTS